MSEDRKNTNPQEPSAGIKLLFWLAIAPVIIIIWALIPILSTVTIFIYELSGLEAGGDFSIIPLIYSGFGGFAMVMAAQILAPSHKKVASIFFGGLVILVGCCSIYNGIGFIPRLVDIAMTLGAGIGTYNASNGEELSF
jgi:hypothetical protein